MPRNLILRYSNSGDWVLDQFMGSGTTLVEAKLLNRNAVGVDINPQSISISERNLQFQCETNSKIFTRNGNATDLHFIKDSHIDFICTHPPYANIIKYSKGIEGDISLLEVEKFLNEESGRRIFSSSEKRENVCCNAWRYKKKWKNYSVRFSYDGKFFAVRLYEQGNYY